VSSWGESAGAISVALHMLTNNGNQQGLFRGAVMQSGGPIPVGDIEHGQQYYDYMVEKTGCKRSSDTLKCLREVPYNTFKKAMDSSPNFFAFQVRAFFIPLLNDLAHSSLQGLVLAWLPRVDGVFLTEPPQYSVLRGHVANVPMITGVFRCRSFEQKFIYNPGNCDDEGTLFSISTINIS
jgi:acetylcholinesterase